MRKEDWRYRKCGDVSPAGAKSDLAGVTAARQHQSFELHAQSLLYARTRAKLWNRC